MWQVQEVSYSFRTPDEKSLYGSSSFFTFGSTGAPKPAISGPVQGHDRVMSGSYPTEFRVTNVLSLSKIVDQLIAGGLT